jgi:membrane protease YdiL (CAAX protease family)
MGFFKTAPLSLPADYFVVNIMPKPATSERMSAFKAKVLRFKTDVLFTLFLLIAVGVPQALFLVHPVSAVYATVAGLVALCVVALNLRRFRKVAIAVSLLPVSMMVSLALPQSIPFGQAIVFYDALLLLGLVYRFMFTLDEPVQDTRLGLKGYLFGLPLLLVLGQVLGAAGFGLLHNQYPFAEISWSLVAVSMVVFAFAEETVFRGLIQQRARYIMHPIMAVILTAGLYTLMSLSMGNVLATVYALVAGTLLSTVYYFKKNLLLTVTMNVTGKLLYLGLLATFIYR